MIDNRTTNLNLPLPNVNNNMKVEDVPRLRDAIAGLDQAVADRATHAELAAAIEALVGGAPGALDTLNELAAAVNDDASFAATITAALASKLSTVPVATSVVTGGVKIGAGLVIDNGVLSTTGAGSGSGLPSFSEMKFSPTSNGQTTFTPAGGYVAGQIELYQNGILLYGGGDDYTASNGTTITLAVGANTVDTFILRKWYYIPIEMAVNKTGDTMTGYLSVPGGASGVQVPRAQEVVLKTGGTMTGPLVLSADPTGDLGAATMQYVLSKMAMYTVARSTNVALTIAEKAKWINVNAAFTQTFAAASTLKDGWYCWLKNNSSAPVILDPAGSELINGAAAEVVLAGQTVMIQCTGSALNMYLIDEGKMHNQLHLAFGNGLGSTLTNRIRSYSSTIENTSLGLWTYNASATDGASVTINYGGRYFIQLSDAVPTYTSMGISKNAANLSTPIDSLTYDQIIAIGSQAANGSGVTSCAAMVRLAAGDVIRAHGQGSTPTDGLPYTFLKLSRIGS